jgi:hypothetical protein
VGAISPRTSVQIIASFGIGVPAAALLVAGFGSVWPEATIIASCLLFGVGAALAPWWVTRKPRTYAGAGIAFMLAMAVVGAVAGCPVALVLADGRGWLGMEVRLDMVLVFVGSLVGAAVGLALCLPFFPAFVKMLLLSERLSLESPDEMARIVAEGAFILAALSGIVVLMYARRPTPALAGEAVLLVAASVLRVVADRRMKARATLRRRVLTKKDQDWLAVPVAAVTLNLDGVLPLTSEDLDAGGVILRRRQGPLSGVYRTGANVEPYALVKLPDGFAPERHEGSAAIHDKEGFGV